MIFIKELEIKKCFAVKHVRLSFENDNNVTIFNCASSYKLKTVLIRAIQQFFCKNTIPEAWKDTKLLKTHGYVRIKFHIANEVRSNDVVDAMRYSKSPYIVYYYLNGDQYIDDLHVFQERCRIEDVAAFYPFLMKIRTYENKNLLQAFVSSSCPMSLETEKSFDMVARFLESPSSQDPHKQMAIARIAELNSLIERQRNNILKKRTFITVANDIGRMFSYLTSDEYTVKFHIKLSNMDSIPKELPWEDIELDNVVTKVQRSDSTDPEEQCIWTQVAPILKILLQISRTLSLAKHLNQKIVFTDTTLLQQHQNIEMIRAVFMSDNDEDKKANIERTNFLQRIVDLCNEYKISVIMNYHAGLILSSTSANFVQCKNSEETDGHSIYVCQNIEPMDLNNLFGI